MGKHWKKPQSTYGQGFHGNLGEFRHLRGGKSLRLYDLLQRRLEHLAAQSEYVKAEGEGDVNVDRTCMDDITRLRRAEVELGAVG